MDSSREVVKQVKEIIIKSQAAIVKIGGMSNPPLLFFKAIYYSSEPSMCFSLMLNTFIVLTRGCVVIGVILP